MANKKYFVWENAKCGGINPEWLEVLGHEFFKIVKDENSEKRYFIKLVDEEEIIFLESTKENYVKWRKEFEHKRYLKKQNKDYEKVPLDFVDENEETLHDKLADEIGNLIKAIHGHTLILFTSYKFLDNVFYETQSKNLPFPLFKMTKGKLNIIDEFKNSKNGVLFASDSAGEGIDIAGDVLSSLIVVRLPFPMPDAKSEYERQKKNDQGEFMEKYIVPQMIIKLRQWIGRGIRRETDTCAFSILDPRANGRYRETILNALPEMPMTTSRTDVSQFILDNKKVEYFE